MNSMTLDLPPETFHSPSAGGKHYSLDIVHRHVNYHNMEVVKRHSSFKLFLQVMLGMYDLCLYQLQNLYGLLNKFYL